MPRSYLVYSAPSGLKVTPYRGNIADVPADAAVTREDTTFEVATPVTTALGTKYPKLNDCRQIFKKKTKFWLFKTPFNPWTVEVSKLPKSSGSQFIVFHAIMNQPEAGSDGDWSRNMTRMYTVLLEKVEKLQVKVLAVPLLGSGQNVKTATKVLIDAILLLRPKHLQKIYIVSKGKQEIPEVIRYCQEEMVLTRGNQPEGGTMSARREREHLPGYESHGTIVVTYIFANGKQGDEHPNPGEPYKGTKRIAYLPDCTEGRRVLGLLKTAFDDRRLTFTIGHSQTTGENNVVRFTGIPLKTSKDGGKRYGYPDPSYLSTVLKYLSDRGITKGQRVDIRASSSRASSAEPQRQKSVPGPTKKKDEHPPLRRLQTAPSTILEPQAPIESQQVKPAQIKKDQDKVGERKEVREETGRGNCMFVSLSMQLKRGGLQDIGHSELRAKLVQYLRDNPNQPDNTPYSAFLDGETWEVFLERMSRDGQWGDHMMLQAAAELFTVEIVVHQDNSGQMSVSPSRPSLGQIMLRLRDRCHYESME